MLYRFAHVLMWITFRIFFRRIDVIGTEKLSHNQPAMLIANHPASFLDAMVLAVFLGRPLHFYVRGDIFAHPLVYRILGFLHMIPIYSQEHGISNLGQNKQTFERGRELLKRGALLLVFPEGFSRLSKQLVPFKKGAARVALQTAFDPGFHHDLVIQTIAINYSFHGLGSHLLIALGEQLPLESYRQHYLDFPAQAVSKLTKDMFVLFERNVVHVREPEQTEPIEALLRMHYREHDFQASSFLGYAQRCCASLAVMKQEEYQGMLDQLGDYRKALQQHGLSDLAVVSQKSFLSLLFGAIFLFPFFILGSLIWCIPAQLSKWIADKAVTRIDFYTSVYTGVLGWMGFLWWTAANLFLWQYETVWISWLMLLSPFFAWTARRWMDVFGNLVAVVKAKRLEQKDPEAMQQLRTSRSKLVFQ